VLAEPGEPPGDPRALRIVPGADPFDQGRGLRADLCPPCPCLGHRRRHGRRFDRQDLRGIALEQRAKRAARPAHPERGNLPQVQEALGVL
jgi:hypothetical protein